MQSGILLEVRNLKTYFHLRSGVLRAVDGLYLTVRESEIVGLVGESGCGKSIAALSSIRLVPEPGRIEEGQILLEGTDILQLHEEEMRGIRGKKVSMIFQDPLASLNPIMTVKEHLLEALKANRNLEGSQSLDEAISLLSKVGITDPAVRLHQYPFQLSGGMNQRLMIALALSGNPRLLIADEPTTNLDVTIQAQVLEVFRELRNESGLSVLLITHNLGIVAQLCDRLCVMYAGRIVEEGPTETVIENPRHPYTQALLRLAPKIGLYKGKLEEIKGEVPDLMTPLTGCRFASRCQYVKEVCTLEEPHLIEVESEHKSACFMSQSEVW